MYIKTINYYYQKYKEKLWKKQLKKKKKIKDEKKVKDRYKNLPEEIKQKLCEYMKKYYLAHKK